MGKFPNWVRPALVERQLVGEEKRLALRGIKEAGQVRADLVRAAAHHDGESRYARLVDLAESLGLSGAYPENVLAGRIPVGDALLGALYGPTGSSMPMAWTGPVDDWGPLLAEAIAAGLAVADETSPPAAVDPVAAEAAAHVDINSGADGSLPPTVASAPGAVSAPPSRVETVAPAVAQTTIPAPELACGDGAPPAPDLDSRRAPGEGSAPALLRDVTAGEGSRPDGVALPPSLIFTGAPVPIENPLDPALDALAQLAQQAALEAQQMEAEMAAARLRWQAALERRDAARKAYDLLDELRRTEQRTPAVAVAA